MPKSLPKKVNDRLQRIVARLLGNANLCIILVIIL